MVGITAVKDQAQAVIVDKGGHRSILGLCLGWNFVEVSIAAFQDYAKPEFCHLQRCSSLHVWIVRGWSLGREATVTFQERNIVIYILYVPIVFIVEEGWEGERITTILQLQHNNDK